MGASPRFALLALATCLFSFPFTRPIFFFRTHRWCLYFDLQLLHDIVSVGIDSASPSTSIAFALKVEGYYYIK